MSISSRGYRVLCRLYSFVLGRLRVAQAWERCPLAGRAALRPVEPELLEPRLLLSGADVAPPVVAEVLVAGSAWSPAFLSHLNSAGLGDGGFSILGGSATQLRSVPWSNVNQVKVRFSEDVQLAAGDLALRGIRTPGGLNVGDFSYDADTFTATWTFAEALAADKWVLDLTDTIADLEGNLLDGDWLNSSDAFPSGDDAAGHDFKFQVNIVRGDVNRSNTVLGDDVILVRNAQFRGTTHPQYNPFLDVNGSGIILGDDVILARNLQFTNLPAADHDLAGPVFAAGLAHDTGSSSIDGVTFDADVGGTVNDPSGVTLLEASLNGGAFVDIAGFRNVDGTFNLNAAALALINGNVTVPDGQHALRIEAEDAFGNATTFNLAFTLDTAAPVQPAFDLSAGSDSGLLGDQQTAAGVVTLTGTTDPAALLALAPGGALSLATGAGVFQFPQVALAAGDNELTIIASDLAGNSSQFTRTIERTGDAEVDVVLAWNQTMLDAITFDASTPPVATRGMAMVSTAVYDAVAAIEGTPGFYVSPSAPAGASLTAAVASAAHRVLLYLYPGQQAMLDAALATSLVQVPDGPSEDDGVALGESIADAVIAIRQHDGWDDFIDFVPGSGPGAWQFTAPMFDVAMAPQWADLTPFAMTSPGQFRPEGPAALTSQEYADAFNEVKSLGSATGGTRTADQTQIARFWADGAGTFTPAGHWNQIASQIAIQQGNSVSANARLFAQLNVAMGDAAIAAWDAKFAYGFWRPITAIQQADTDGNDLTVADKNWQPLLISPPFPEYTSGHSTFSGAGAEVLTAIFGDDIGFTITSPSLLNITRSFASFDEAAEEAGRSRIYGGIHYSFSNEDGKASGRALAQLVMSRFAVSSDEQAPMVVIESPLTGMSGVVHNENITVAGRVLDNLSGVASLQYQLDDGPLTNLSFIPASGAFSLPLNLPLDGSAQGAHTLTFLAIDAAGNAAAPVVLDFTLDTLAPAVTLTSLIEGQVIDVSSRLIGSVDATGSSIVSLNYKLDGGAAMPVLFDPVTGQFDEFLNLSQLEAGSHVLTVTATDAAGNIGVTTLNLQLNSAIPFTVASVTPAPGSSDVGSTFRPQVYFTRAVNPATLTSDNFYATDTTGAKVPATIVPAMDGSFAWLFFTNPLPGASTITVHVEGATILAQSDAAPLDADNNGTSGGNFTYQFSTVSLVPLAGTTLTGRVYDPGVDLKPMTFDDFRAGPDGIAFSADDVFLSPIAGVKVFILGLEDEAVFTDANGFFHFDAVPGGTIKLAIDGRTATNAPAGFYFPEMVMDQEIEVGQANTVMGTMGTREEREAHLERTEVYLPRIRTDILQTVSETEVTMVGVDTVSAPNLTDEERQYLTLEVQPGSIIGPNGQPLTGAAAQVGISTVPPELVRDMLPPGVLQHTFDITIQAPDAAAFAAPLQLTFPNVFNAAPGTKLSFLSFDHTTGRLVIEGTATVSADGQSVVTDPGTGITKPGWHGLIGQAVDSVVNAVKAFVNHPVTQAVSRLAKNLVNLVNATKEFIKAGVPIIGAIVGGTFGGPGGAALGLYAGQVVTATYDVIENHLKTLYQGFTQGWTKEQIYAELDKNSALYQLKLIPGFGYMLTLAEAWTKIPEILADMETLATTAPPGLMLPDQVNDFKSRSWNTEAAPTSTTEGTLAEQLQRLAESQGWPAPTPQEVAQFGDVRNTFDDANRGLLPADRDLTAFSRSFGEMQRLLSDAPDTPENRAALGDHLEYLAGNFDTVRDYTARRDADVRELVSLQDRLIDAAMQGEPTTSLFPATAGPVHYQYSNDNAIIRGTAANISALSASLGTSRTGSLSIYEPSTGLVGNSIFQTPRVSGRGFPVRVTLLPDTDADTDGDGLSDSVENMLGTDPAKWSTTGDGVSDGAKIAQGLNPLGSRAFATGLISRLPLQGDANEVVIEGSTLSGERQTAFVATGLNGLAIVDVTQPRQTVVLGQIDLAGDAVDVAVDSRLGIAAVAAGAGGLHLIDVAAPTAPSVLRTIAGDVRQVEVLDGVAYAAVGTALRAYDLLTGELLNTLSPGLRPITGLARDGFFLYTMDDQNVLRSVEVSTGIMVQRDALTMPAGGGKLFVGGGVAYIGAEISFTGGFATASVADPANLTLLSGVDSTSIAGRAIAANGSGRAVSIGSPGNFGNLIQLLDVTDPTDTDDFLTQFTLPADPRSIALGAGFAFVADGAGGLVIVNFLPLDNQGQPPIVAISGGLDDIDAGTPGVQLLEGQSITLDTVITDDVQVRNVELLINGQVVRNDVSFPFDLTTALPSIVANGSDQITVQVRATDTGGNVGASAEIAVQLVPDSVAPALVASNVAEGATFGRSFRTVVLTFSEPIDEQQFGAMTVQVIGGGGPISPQNIQFRLLDRQVALTFAELEVDDYVLRIDATQVRDRAGNAMGLGHVDTSFTVQPFSVEWVNADGGNWHTAANWSTGVVPTADDDVFIGDTVNPVTIVSGTVAIQSLVANGSLELAGGTLDLAGDSQINGSFELSGGLLRGSGALAVAGTHSLISGTMIGTGQTILLGNGTINSMNLDDDRIVEIKGTTTWVGSSGERIWFNIGGGGGGGSGTIKVASSGVFDIQNDAHMGNWSGSAGQFNNLGTVRKTSGAGTTTLNVKFNNSSIVEVQTGTLHLSGGGDHTGSFGTIGAAVLQFGQGLHNLQASSAITGNVLFTGFSQNGVSDVTTVGGTFAPTNTTIGANSDVVFNSNGATQNFTLTGSGRLRGSGMLTVAGNHTLVTGTMSGTGQTILLGNGTINSLLLDDDRLLEIRGATTWTGGSGQRIWFNVGGGGSGGNGGTISVVAGAIFDIQSDAHMGYWSGSAGQFNNLGTVRKTSGAGTTTLDAKFNNSSIVEVQTGSVHLSGGGDHAGSFSTIGAAVLQFGQGLHNLQATSSITGNVLFTGFSQNGVSDVTTVGGTFAPTNTTIGANSDVVFNSNGATQNLTLTGSGRLRGSGTLTVAGNHALVTGTMSGAGQTVLLGNGTINSMNLDDDRLVEIRGTTTWTGSASQRIWFNLTTAGGGGTITVTNGGVFDIQTDAHMGYWAGSAGQFNNLGAVRKSIGTGATGMAAKFINDSAVEVQTGTLHFAGGGAHTGTFNAAAGGTVQLGAGTHTITGGAVTGAGTFLISGSATVDISVAYSIANLTMTGGTLTGGAAVTVTGTHTITLGTMIGSGQTVFQGNGTINSMNLDDNRLVEIRAITTWTGSASQRIWFNLTAAGGGGTISVVAGAIFDIQTDAHMGYWAGSAGQFNNAGTVRKTIGTGTTGMAARFNNSSIVEVQTGTLHFSGGGAHAGTFNTAAGAAVQLGAGTHTITGGGVTGAGTLLISGSATVDISVPYSIANLTMTGGTLTGSAAVTVTGTHTITLGTMIGSGQTVFQGNGTINSMNLDEDRLVEIRGTTAWTGSASQRIWFNLTAAGGGGTMVVATGGVFDIQTDALIDHWAGSAGRVDNFGTIKKTAGVGITTIEVQLINEGTIRVETGTLRLTQSFTNTGAIVVLPGGTFAVTGAFTNAALAFIAIEVGGADAGQFGRLAVTGAASLAGTLQLSFVNGFLPTLGQRFSVLTFASRTGIFDSILGNDAGNGVRLDPDYQTTKLDLVGAPS